MTIKEKESLQKKKNINKKKMLSKRSLIIWVSIVTVIGVTVLGIAVWSLVNSKKNQCSSTTTDDIARIQAKTDTLSSSLTHLENQADVLEQTLPSNIVEYSSVIRSVPVAVQSILIKNKNTSEIMSVIGYDMNYALAGVTFENSANNVIISSIQENLSCVLIFTAESSDTWIGTDIEFIFEDETIETTVKPRNVRNSKSILLSPSDTSVTAKKISSIE